MDLKIVDHTLNNNNASNYQKYKKKILVIPQIVKEKVEEKVAPVILAAFRVEPVVPEHCCSCCNSN